MRWEVVFIHLHTHSNFSFLDGGSSIEDLVRRAADLGMPALALTDHDNLCGAVKFHRAAGQAGIKPIQGAEVTLEDGSHLTLLARGPEGYRSLCRMLTRAHLENRRRQPRVSLANLKDNAKGLIALSGCRRGLIPRLLMARRYDEACRWARFCREIWGSDFYLEMQDTLVPGSWRLNRLLAELGEDAGIELVATNNVHYAVPEDFPVHDVLVCVRTLTRVQDVHPERPLNGEAYLKDSREMAVLFREYPQALENTWRIAESCRPALELGRDHFPEYDLPPGEKAEEVLCRLVYEGATRRYGRVTAEVRDRLEHELNIINTLGYAGYFLVVWDIVNFALREGIRFAGRGSAADSLVAYCLGITEVDSLARGLLFERFMSPERGEKPDIDIDFDARRRDRVAAYVYAKYGADKVACVATYNTFRARSALRDLGKALGLEEKEIGALAKRLPAFSQADQIRPLLAKLPELRISGLERERFALLLSLCEKVAGFPRFLGTHLGGLVISREPLADLTPLQMAAKGMVITQFDKEDVEEMGFVKLDLLSLRALAAVDDAVDTIKKREPSFSYDDIPLDDPATYRRLNSGETIGIFQLESPAQRALQARLGASKMEDIVASVALIRPGPIKGNMVEPYIARRHGQEPVSFMHPRLEPILAKTYGVVLFQEQVIEIAMAVADFTPGEADNLRRVMTHARSPKAMEEIGRVFVERAVKNGVDRENAERIFACMQGYASYGFCEAHAAAFATTAFKTAYLLEHYPAEFYAALLSNQPMGYYPPHVILNEARRRGIRVLPPCVNSSLERFTVEAGGIRVGLMQVKGLSRVGIQSIIENRPFTSLADLFLRASLARDELANLILCGALDSVGKNRRRMMAELLALSEARRHLGKESLDWSCEYGECLYLPDFSEAEKYRLELEILGIDVRGHIMQHLREILRRQGFKDSRSVKEEKAGARVKVAGLLLAPHRPPTKSGKITVFLSLEDEFGLTDVTVFEDVYQRFGHLIFAPQPGPLAVEGMVQRRGNGVSLIAKRLWHWG